jgi:hypothetical protein
LKVMGRSRNICRLVKKKHPDIAARVFRVSG